MATVSRAATHACAVVALAVVAALAGCTDERAPATTAAPTVGTAPGVQGSSTTTGTTGTTGTAVPRPSPSPTTAAPPGAPTTEGGTASPPSDGDALSGAARALVGRWSGPSGTVVIEPDGTAVMSVWLCDTADGCAASVLEGTVTADQQGLVVRGDDGTTTRLAAYVDGRERLHLGIGPIAPLRDRSSTMALGPAGELVVQGSSCALAGSAVPCSWTARDGVEALAVDLPDGPLVLVADPEAGLLMAPVIWDQAYERS